MNINQRLARLIDLVPYITRHQGIALEDLANRFNISVSELEKDLWLLYCCGLPGQTPLELMEFSFEDGFVSVRNADELKHPRTLSKIELATLVMGLEVLSNNGHDLAKKLLARLKEKLKSKLKIEQNQITAYLKDIERAIQENRVVRITYKGKMRDLIPFEIYFENSNGYLRAFCKLANARRTFNINRIDSFELLDSKELPPNEVPSISMVFKARLKIHKNGRAIREIFRATELGNEIEINYFSKEWLTREVLAFGGNVEALTPEIRSEVAKLAQAGKNLYLG